jgi:hypothetical protein
MTKAFELIDVVKIYPDFKLGPIDMSLEPGIDPEKRRPCTA